MANRRDSPCKTCAQRNVSQFTFPRIRTIGSLTHPWKFYTACSSEVEKEARSRLFSFLKKMLQCTNTPFQVLNCFVVQIFEEKKRWRSLKQCMYVCKTTCRQLQQMKVQMNNTSGHVMLMNQ